MEENADAPLPAVGETNDDFGAYGYDGDCIVGEQYAGDLPDSENEYVRLVSYMKA